MLSKEQNEIIKEWNNEQLYDGEALFELLDTIYYSLPDLFNAIINTDDEVIPDNEALDILINVLEKFTIKSKKDL